jgi:hypothetical protein
MIKCAEEDIWNQAGGSKEDSENYLMMINDRFIP